MATLFRLLGFRFFYLSFDLLAEPCHVHITNDAGKLCKYWIRADGQYIRAFSQKFTEQELKDIETALSEQIDRIRQIYENDCAQNRIPVNYYRKEA